MDSVQQVLRLWQDEAIIVLVTLAAFLLFHFATKLWSAPLDAALGVILAISIGFAVAGIILAHSMFGIHFSARALWFVALYIWCVLGMMFVASRGVHRGKLFLGLASQAGVLYTLFIFF